MSTIETPPANALRNPEAYLASARFSLRIPRCPGTGLPVSFADLGDPDGTPVLWVLPSGCSRWVAAPQDPLARLYGIRLIVIDRPGCGATPEVPLGDRIRISGDMAASVLEHLKVKPAHVIVNSAGVYYALDLLLRHSSSFATSLNPPPSLYMISPWSPLLPASHPDYYPSYFTWIPTPLIATQHITLPQLAKLADTGSNLWTTGSKTFWSGLTAAKELIGNATSAPAKGFSLSGYSNLSGIGAPSVPSKGAHEKALPIPPGGARESARVPLSTSEATVVPMVVDGVTYRSADADFDDDDGDGDGAGDGEVIEGKDVAPAEVESKGDGLWGRFPCCVSCTTTEYMQAESFSGIGQEHLVCLNRGPTDTGPAYLENAIDTLASLLSRDVPLTGNQEDETHKSNANPNVLDVRIWWGWRDTMVPRKGQQWFNRNIQRYPGSIKVTIRDVVDGDHTDLLGRAEGIYEVYALIRKRASGREDGEDEE